MKVLWISAHPDSRSLSGSLGREATETLTRLGHRVRQSDLYAMRWKPTVDTGDFPADFPAGVSRGLPGDVSGGLPEGLPGEDRAECPGPAALPEEPTPDVRNAPDAPNTPDAPGAAAREPAGGGEPRHRHTGGRLVVGAAQERAYRTRALSPDIAAEQEKTRWADVLVFHFPMWWLGPPAILKGWFDRVLTQGFAFGVKDPHGAALRYGDGGLAGKRAMVVTTIGARESSFGPRGIHGHIDDILFPLHHGTFWYAGMAALPPFVVYGADRLTRERYTAEAERLRARLRALPTTDPIPFRRERGGDYDAELVLREEVAPGHTGLAIHRADG